MSTPLPAASVLASDGTLVELRAALADEVLPGDGSTWDDWGDGERGPAPRDLGRMVVTADGVPIGTVSWHTVGYGATVGSDAVNIGISLVPDARGHGYGSLAQRLLAQWLLGTFPVTRIEASTDVENLAEQRSLAKAGFVREGVLRSAQERRDGRHDLVGYSLLRSDLARSDLTGSDLAGSDSAKEP